MYATDFEFNGELASNHGLMVCTWGDESDVAEGGNIEPNTFKPPNRDTFDWYGGQFNEPLVWNVSIANSMCPYVVTETKEIINGSVTTYLADDLVNYEYLSIDTTTIPEELVNMTFNVWDENRQYEATYYIVKADLDNFILNVKNKSQIMFYPVGVLNLTLNINFTTLPNMETEISIEREREIARWLMKPGYKWTRFLNDRDGSESLWYKCNVSVTPHQLFGSTIGFDLTFTSNCAYGFTDEQVITDVVSSSNPLTFNISTDINEYVYPIITLGGKGEIELYNENDLEQNLTNAKQTKVKIRSDIENEIKTIISGNVTDTSTQGRYISSPYLFEKDVSRLEDRDIQIYQEITASINPNIYNHIGLRIVGVKNDDLSTVLYRGYDEYINLTLSNDIQSIYAQVAYWNTDFEVEYTEQFNCKVQLYNAGSVILDADNDIITGIVDPKTDFNYYFPHLVDGENVIKTTSDTDIDIEIKYREARRVIL